MGLRALLAQQGGRLSQRSQLEALRNERARRMGQDIQGVAQTGLGALQAALQARRDELERKGQAETAAAQRAEDLAFRDKRFGFEETKYKSSLESAKAERERAAARAQAEAERQRRQDEIDAAERERKAGVEERRQALAEGKAQTDLEEGETSREFKEKQTKADREFKANQARLNRAAARERARIMAAAQKAEKERGKTLPATQANSIATNRSVLREYDRTIAKVEKAIKAGEFNTGFIPDATHEAFKYIGLEDPKYAHLKGMVTNLGDLQMRDRSGAAIKIDEEDKLSGFLGGTRLDQATLLRVIKEQRDRVRRQLEEVESFTRDSGYYVPGDTPQDPAGRPPELTDAQEQTLRGHARALKAAGMTRAQIKAQLEAMRDGMLQ